MAEIHIEMPNNDMNQTHLPSESTAQQMVELQRPLLSSQPTQLPEGDEMTTNIQVMVQSCGDGLWLEDCCIYRVPIRLCHPREEAYIPKVVSIGPFHYGDKRLQDMERHKQILFKRFTQRAMSSLDDLVGLVKQLEPRIRASYSDPIDLSEQQLVKLTLVDAGFIIELFILCCVGNNGVKDAKLSQPWLTDYIYDDLILLENQLPYFVIEELFDKAFPIRGGLPSFLELTYKCFRHHNVQALVPNPHVKIRHFTDLIRLFYVKGKTSPRYKFSDEVARHILLYNAKALQEAGIKLKAANNTSNSFLDLKFSGHDLEIPKIDVTAITETLLGNLIALEQCHYPYAGYVTDYALVMDFLIDTYEDVNLLVHNKIVRNYIGDANNVASLFNGLSEHVVHTDFNSEYLDICKKLNGYCEDPWNKMKATLRHDYCRTPWQTLVSIAAIVLLILSVVQTIFSILQVVK